MPATDPRPHGTRTDSVPTAADDEIDALRTEIDRLDAEILDAILRRTEVSKRIGAARMAAGGPRIVYSREMAVLDRFDALGAEGRELAMMLLRLGRGRLGGR
ncbi:chorismate mutase [Pseudonocardia sp. NPDC046786]|uniref:chorismate mutase n=1 Tax=Pseudonocardia sp. NPDC046786 TaxID=3155471 RepID=UPI0033D0D774